MKESLKAIGTLRERKGHNFMKKQKKENCAMKSSGVTLIALIITIIILLILAMTSVALIMRWNIVEKTEYAAEGYQGASEREILEVAFGEYAMDKTAGNEVADLIVNEAEVTNGTDWEKKGWTVTFPSGNKYIVDDEGDIREAVQVTIGEEIVTLTEDTVANYLGKEVKDFKKDSSEEAETVKVGTEQKEYKVSTKYRLYYVDFEGKYGDKGAVYLKADCCGDGNYPYPLPLTDTTESTNPNIKIRDLNPELYKGGNPPSKDNNNMKAVTWLLNIDNWASLKDTVSDEYKSKIKYIVGAPSLEMMMDSYNTHYGLTGDTPDTTEIVEGKRIKLFYKYPYNDKYYGYGVGPSNDQSVKDGYFTRTSDNTVQTDAKVGTMYYPGINHYYCLASPSAYDNSSVMSVRAGEGGYVDPGNYNFHFSLCPLVCLDSSAHLNLE